MRALFVAALLLALVHCATAQEPVRRHAAVDAVFAPHVTADGPGCAVGVVRRGELVYSRGYGLADVERATPFTTETVFGIGSIYKQFVAAAVLMLVREGKLSLEDDIRKFVPEIPDYGARITVRHLLDHTHGLRDYCGRCRRREPCKQAKCPTMA